MKKLIFFVIFNTVFIFHSCSDENNQIQCFPRIQINAQYNIGLPAYNSLLVPNGYVQLRPDGTNGSRGLIIVNTGNNFNAYDRNAPHICPDKNTTLEVIDGIKIRCPEDRAEWMLLTGQPLNDATFGQPLYQYRVNQNSRWLIITN